ncbi:unnamed protein product, partial [Rotaria magnacalcarata]
MYFNDTRTSSVFAAQNDFDDVNFDWPHPRACTTTQHKSSFELADKIIQRTYSLQEPP